MTSFHRSIALLFTLAFIVTPLCADNPGEPIGHGLWRISGTSPSLPQSELEPLRQIIGGAQFVGLGEAEHTSGGFYEMKDRIFRYLVEQMGFRAFGIESGWLRVERVEQYIQTGQGTALTAIGGVAQVFRSTELLALIEWMRAWNVAHPDDRVHAYGFDIQSQAFQNGAALIDFLHQLGIADEDPRLAGIRACDGVETDYFNEGVPFPPELYEQCQSALAATAAYFDQFEKDIEKQTSADALGYARIHLVGLQAWEEEIFYLESDIDRAGRARDRGMAYVAQALRNLRWPHARTALWAHNGHIAKRAGDSGYIAVDMGTILANDLGDQNYVAIGQVAREIYLDWIFLGACGLDPIPETDQSIERFFAHLGPGAGVLANLDAHPPFLEPGAVYTLASVPMVPRNHFDALVYLAVSPKMHPLAWPSCQ